VQIFDSTGTYLSQFGSHGIGDGQFANPAGVAIDPTNGHIVVAETTGTRVQIFDSTGVFISKFGTNGSGNGQFLNATDVAIDPTSHHILVTDGGNNRVQVFDSGGTYLSQFGSAGAGNGQFSFPFGIAVDPTNHNIVVVDEFNSRVQVFGSTGTFISTFGSGGSGDGQFGEPRRVAVDPTSGNIVVTDANLSRVQIFTIQIAPAPVLQSAASRRLHGAAGTFDLALSLVSTNPTTDPRQGPTQTFVFVFDKPVNAATVTVTEGVATAAAPVFSGNAVIVGLTGVSNQQYVTVSLTGVDSTDGGINGTGSARVGFLTGDVNQSRVVSVADLGLINAQLSQPVTAANFLKDVNANGTLTVADKGIANANLTKALPLP
jgi:DNA-binding beta-propeller fold protein YncE